MASFANTGRSTAEAGVAASTLASADASEWPIQLYRKTQNYGWQKLLASSSSSSSSSSSCRKKQLPLPDKKQRQHCGSRETETKTKSPQHLLHASPRHEAILVRQLRLRIRIESTSTVVTRRGNRLRVDDSSQGTKCLVLVFPNELACRDFCRVFSQLNPLQCCRLRQRQPAQQQQRQEEMNRDFEATAKATNDKGGSDTVAAVGAPPTPVAADTASVAPQEQQEVFNYIAHLLQTPEFVSYMTGLEAALYSRPEGIHLLQDLVQQQQQQQELGQETWMMIQHGYYEEWKDDDDLDEDDQAEESRFPLVLEAAAVNNNDSSNRGQLSVPAVVTTHPQNWSLPTTTAASADGTNSTRAASAAMLCTMNSSLLQHPQQPPPPFSSFIS